MLKTATGGRRMTTNSPPLAACELRGAIMCTTKATVLRLSPITALSTLTALVIVGAATAQTAPPDFTASPDVYKVRAENSSYRLVEGIWKPGQRDQMHSHPEQMYYWATPCSMRWHLPDGKTRDLTVIAGQAGAQAAIAAHVVENIGSAECRVVMFEAK
jgi:hypothetical protein